MPRTAPSESNFAQGFKRNTTEMSSGINGLASPTFESARLAKDYDDMNMVGLFPSTARNTATNYASITIPMNLS